MSKHDKYEGKPTIREQRLFPNEHKPRSKRKGKKRFGIRYIPKPEVFAALHRWQWYRRCRYHWYLKPRDRDNAMEYFNKQDDYYSRNFMVESCER